MGHGSVALIMLLMAPWSALWRAYVLTMLWAWFVVPAFGAPQIGLAVAYGLALLATLMLWHPDLSKRPDREPGEHLGIVVTLAIAGPALALLVGFIAKQFV